MHRTGAKGDGKTHSRSCRRRTFFEFFPAGGKCDDAPSFDQIVYFNRTVHDWFFEWTIWTCDARGALIAPISSGFVIDKSPYSISDFVITPLGSGFQMKSKN